MYWFAALALLLSQAAHADSRLRLTSDRPIVIVINLVPYTFGDGTTHVVDFKTGKEGRQNVRVLNLVGQEVWQGQVDVPAGREIKARWTDRAFEVWDTRPLNDGAPTGNPGPVRSGAQTLGAIARQVEADPQQETLDDVAALLKQAGTATPGAAPTTEEAAPPPQGVASKLKLVSRTTSWANVYIGDKKLEFRGDPEPVLLDLPSGAYPVQVKDFQDREVWGRGTIWVYPDVVVELHFSKTPAPTALVRPEAWRPDP